MMSLNPFGLLNRKVALVLKFLSIVASCVLFARPAASQSLTTLTSFDSTNGAQPYGGLMTDDKGDLLGTTSAGGEFNLGTVFEIVKTDKGYSSTPIVLANFNGTDGQSPEGSLIADDQGNLFGTTELGGASDFGTVFEIEKIDKGYAGTPKTLVSFSGTNGALPYSALIADDRGNLFGTTIQGGPSDYGTVFEIEKTEEGYSSTPTTLVTFNGSTKGGLPFSGLLADDRGNLFGTTTVGGAFGSGTVFEILYDAKKHSYLPSPVTLVNFDGSNGAYVYGDLTSDDRGNIFGATAGGGASNDGTVFEIVKTDKGYASTPTNLVTFDIANGQGPYSSLLVDERGNLFGTTGGGGGASFGTVFEIFKTDTGYANTPYTLIDFNGTNGWLPTGKLVGNARGSFFGITDFGGAFGKGTVYEVTGSGFIPPMHFPGRPEADNCRGFSISRLTHTYGGIAYAAREMGYDNVDALLRALDCHCRR